MLSGISLPQILIIALIVILLFGTSKLKNLGKDLGGAIKGFKESLREGDTDEAPSKPQLSQDKREGAETHKTETPQRSEQHKD